MKLYGLRNCDSSKKALMEIRNTGQDIEFIDIRTNSPSLLTMQGWLNQHGDKVIVNRKSTTWRKLNDADRLAPALKLLEAHPTLIKRPIIVVRDTIYVGWNAEVKSALGIT